LEAIVAAAKKKNKSAINKMKKEIKLLGMCYILCMISPMAPTVIIETQKYNKGGFTHPE
jgi:hypothetical protein